MFPDNKLIKCWQRKMLELKGSKRKILMKANCQREYRGCFWGGWHTAVHCWHLENKLLPDKLENTQKWESTCPRLFEEQNISKKELFTLGTTSCETNCPATVRFSQLSHNLQELKLGFLCVGVLLGSCAALCVFRRRQLCKHCILGTYIAMLQIWKTRC